MGSEDTYNKFTVMECHFPIFFYFYFFKANLLCSVNRTAKNPIMYIVLFTKQNSEKNLVLFTE